MNNGDSPTSPVENPFIRPPFWGREYELRIINDRLASRPPQCCAIVGETFIGKSTLLHHLVNPENEIATADQKTTSSLTFVSLDCRLSLDLGQKEYAAFQFWWELYHKTKVNLCPQEQSKLVKPPLNAESKVLIDTASELKYALGELIRDQEEPVVFVLDNFDIVAHLDPRNSEWLRSLLLYNCALVVASRHLLYLLYQYHDPKAWNDPSPLYNLFSDPIYLGLLPAHEVQVFLLEASIKAKKLGSIWTEQDLAFIKNFCGCHPEIIRIGCKNLFKYRLQSHHSFEANKKGYENTFLRQSIISEANVICGQLWFGLADEELSDIPKQKESSREKDSMQLSPHQQGILAIANGETPPDGILFKLEQRGLIEHTAQGWRVFADVMRIFISDQEAISTTNKQPAAQKLSGTALSSIVIQNEVPEMQKMAPSFTYLEGKVYEYLKSRVGQVCDREEMKKAVWNSTDLPSTTALQKMIERIREKIEPEANNPRYLIAIRGQGYMLRKIPPIK